ARFQSAMFDADTLIVTYDGTRGEPRGSRSRKADPAALGLGACVDCGLCVQVCPTGIDIRNGLQYECIGCAACVDVCDEVMDKMNYPRGLIRYSTENALAHNWSKRQIWAHLLRPRVLAYTALLLALCFALLMALTLRTPLKVDVVRDRATLARLVEGGRIENLYQLQLMNATEVPRRYHLGVEGLPGITVATQTDIDVGAAQSRWIAVRVQVPYGTGQAGANPLHFIVTDEADPHARVVEKSVFIVPN
ncbi:MAG: 4Fe-4S binding protein, partial [Betaproteobacteria bacterium]|nr:4Fe-4S binding protein [Betaproteobacteria bacterium]